MVVGPLETDRSRRKWTDLLTTALRSKTMNSGKELSRVLVDVRIRSFCVVGEDMRSTLLVIVLSGLLAAPMLAQNASGQGDAPKVAPAGGDKKGDDKKGDDKKGEEKSLDDIKGKELKIYKQASFSQVSMAKDLTKMEMGWVVNSPSDLLKIQLPALKAFEKNPEVGEKQAANILGGALRLKKDEKIDWDKQSVVIVTAGKLDKAGKVVVVMKVVENEADKKVTVAWTFATVGIAGKLSVSPPGIPATGPSGLVASTAPATVALIEKVGGEGKKVEFVKVGTFKSKDKKPDDKKKPDGIKAPPPPPPPPGTKKTQPAGAVPSVQADVAPAAVAVPGAKLVPAKD
jgi:hypothetical protein